MIMVLNADGDWTPTDTPLEDGQVYRLYNLAGGFAESVFSDSTGQYIESEWVRSELQRTDILVTLPDYPHLEKILDYRDKLRKYDYSSDRPVTPITEKGTQI
jgi:hypothetical protein